jgi:hypothetical protein
MITHGTLVPELPKETPQTAFGAGSPSEDPMRNFGFTIAAYAVLWAVLIGFLILSWRRQAALDARLGELESALQKGPKK